MSVCVCSSDERERRQGGRRGQQEAKEDEGGEERGKGAVKVLEGLSEAAS